MIDYRQSVLKNRVNTIVGSLLIGSWSLGCGLILWQASFDQNPIADAFAQVIYSETQIDF